MSKRFWVALVFVLSIAVSAAAQPITILHDPWLNWDFINRTGVMANDFHIIVDNPAWVPPEVFKGVFPTFQVCPGEDTLLSWCGADVPAGGVAHMGLYMLGSGRILDAYWTQDGIKVGPSVPITYELTRIYDPDPVIPGNSEIHMLLQMSPGYYGDPGNTGTRVGWNNIRTFANIPAGMLGLENLNESLDLGTLLSYEVTPREGGPGGGIITDPIWIEPESFFDVYFDLLVPDDMLGPQFESLLVADVILDDGMGGYTTVGWFWNLNPQCPEPGTYALVGFGLAALVLRLRRKR
jgi:hypothetical protein